MPDNKFMSVELGKKPELKKYAKKMMPFVQMAKEKVFKHGINAINLTMDFDEKDVIEKNMDYIAYTLEVSFWSIKINFNLNVNYFGFRWKA